MQVACIEAGRDAKRLVVVQSELLVSKGDEATVAHFHQNAVDMDCRQRQGITHLRLRQRQVAAHASGEADCIEALVDFTEQMADSLERRAMPHVDYPFASD